MELAASLLRLLMSHGAALTLATWEENLVPTVGKLELNASLRRLALISPSRGLTREGFEKWCASVTREGGGIFLQGESSLPSPLPPCEVVQA